MSETTNEIIIEIANTLGLAANDSTESWDYVAYMFEASSLGGSSYLYENGERLTLQTKDFKKELRENFLRLRELTRSQDDEYWKKCLIGVRYEGRKFKMLFEFDDSSRWAITPGNARDAYKIIIGDLFPDDFND